MIRIITICTIMIMCMVRNCIIVINLKIIGILIRTLITMNIGIILIGIIKTNKKESRDTRAHSGHIQNRTWKIHKN